MAGDGGAWESPRARAACLLVLVSGYPASGKTTLARPLAASCGWPLVSRDEYKEFLFDQLGTGDRDWSRRVGGASWEMMRRAVELVMGTRSPLVAEANFGPSARGWLRDAVTRFGYATAEISLAAPPAVLLERFVDRDASGERHPGHVQEEGWAEQRERVRVLNRPVALGPVLVLDSEAPPAHLLGRARAWLAGVGATSAAGPEPRGR